MILGISYHKCAITKKYKNNTKIDMFIIYKIFKVKQIKKQTKIEKNSI